MLLMWFYGMIFNKQQHIESPGLGLLEPSTLAPYAV